MHRRTVPAHPVARRLAVALGAFTLWVGAALAGAPAHAVTNGPSAAAAPAPPAAHPYTDPIWYPLTRPAKVACVMDNPGCPTPRSYFALDLTAVDTKAGTDPVYAAGAGVAHIGSSTGVCGSSNSSPQAGRWVWVDHGGGVYSKYEHLATITVTDGQRVTPATQLGTVGSTGDTQCSRQYLDFAVGHSGINGPKDAFADLVACNADGTSFDFFPATVSSYHTFNEVPQYDGSTGLTLPDRGRGCVPSPYPLTPDVPTHVTASGGHGTFTVRWAAPPASRKKVDHETVTMQTYHPSTRTYSTTTYRVVKAGAVSTVFSKLDQGRRYRARVDFHNRTGVSADSPWHAATVT